MAGSQTGGKVAEQKVGFITGSQGSRHWEQGSSPADNLLILPAPAHSTTHHLSLANNKVTAFKRFHFTRRPNGFLLPCWCSLNVKIFFHDFVQVGQSLLVSRPPPSLVSSKLRHFSLFAFFAECDARQACACQSRPVHMLGIRRFYKERKEVQ